MRVSDLDRRSKFYEFLGKKFLFDVFMDDGGDDVSDNADKESVLLTLSVALSFSSEENDLRFPAHERKALREKMRSEYAKMSFDFVFSNDESTKDLSVGPRFEKDESEDEPKVKKQKIENEKEPKAKRQERKLEEILSLVPDELWFHAFAMLPKAADILSIGLVSKEWMRTIKIVIATLRPSFVFGRSPKFARNFNDVAHAIKGPLDLSYNDTVRNDALAALTSLTELDLRQNHTIGGKGLAKLSNLTKLTMGKLELSGESTRALVNLTDVEFEGYDWFPSDFDLLTNLKKLAVVNGSTFYHNAYASFSKLETLIESQAKIIGFERNRTKLSEIFPSVRSLTISLGWWLDEKAGVKTMTNLTELNLVRLIDKATARIIAIDICDEDLIPLTNLKKLSIENARRRPDGVPNFRGRLTENALRGLTNLTHLDIKGRGSEVKEALSSLTGLTFLNVSKSRGLTQKHLLSLTSLVELNVSWIIDFTFEGTTDFLNRMGNLTSLKCRRSGCNYDVLNLEDGETFSRLTTLSVEANMSELRVNFGKFENLTDLNVDFKNFTDFSVHDKRAVTTWVQTATPGFAKLSKLKKLKMKGSVYGDAIDDVLDIVLRNGTLEELHVIHSTELKDERVSEMTELTVLRISNCPYVTSKAFSNLTQLKKLRWDYNFSSQEDPPYPGLYPLVGLTSLSLSDRSRQGREKSNKTRWKCARLKLRTKLYNLDGASKQALLKPEDF